MENDELKDVIKMDFPDHSVNNEKIISVCKSSNRKYNNSSLKLKIVLIIALFIIVSVPVTYYIINAMGSSTHFTGLYQKVNGDGENNGSTVSPNTPVPTIEVSGEKINSGFFETTSSGKTTYPIEIGYETEYSIFSDNRSLELEVLVGYFGDIRATGLYPEDSDLPKIVVRTGNNPVEEEELVEIEDFLEKYKLSFVFDDGVICGCKYTFPDEAEGIKVSIDNKYFSGTFGEIRIGLYVGYMYRAATIYYCKNEEDKTICISNISVDEAMKIANYDYVSGTLGG